MTHQLAMGWEEGMHERRGQTMILAFLSDHLPQAEWKGRMGSKDTLARKGVGADGRITGAHLDVRGGRASLGAVCSSMMTVAAARASLPFTDDSRASLSGEWRGAYTLLSPSMIALWRPILARNLSNTTSIGRR